MTHLVNSLNKFATQSTQIMSTGQAGFIIKSKSGKTIGIDLYLSNCVEDVEGHDGYHRLLPQIYNPEDLKLDYIIATHFHRDHFDIESIPSLMKNDKTMLFCAYDCKSDVDNLCLDKNRVTFVKPGDYYEVDDFVLNFINCDHGEGAPLAVGVIVSVDGKNILEVGDSCLHLERKEEYLKAGLLDVLIAPINGMYGNLNEHDCMLLAELLQPRLTIPCHFGMFASHKGSPGDFIDLMREKNLKYILMTQGECVEI